MMYIGTSYDIFGRKRESERDREGERERE